MVKKRRIERNGGKENNRLQHASIKHMAFVVAWNLSWVIEHRQIFDLALVIER